MLDRLETAVKELVESMGYELVDFKCTGAKSGKTLMVMADKPTDFNVGDCARISRELSETLDLGDWELGDYSLEVSSPGLNRPLKTLDHFKQFIGKKVQIQVRASTSQRKNYKGYIQAIEGETVCVEVAGIRHKINFETIQKARLMYESKEI